MKPTKKSQQTRATSLVNEIRSLRNEGKEEEAKRLIRKNYIELNAQELEFYEGEGESRYYIKENGKSLDWSDNSINRLLAETIENHVNSSDNEEQNEKLRDLLEVSGFFPRSTYHRAKSLAYAPLALGMDIIFGSGKWCVCDKFTEIVTKATDTLYSKLDDLETFEPIYLMESYNYYCEPEEEWKLYATPKGYQLVRKGLAYLTIPYGTKINPDNPRACEFFWNASEVASNCGLWGNHFDDILSQVVGTLKVEDHLGWSYETEKLMPISAVEFETDENGNRTATMWVCRTSGTDIVIAKRGNLPNSYKRVAWADSNTLADDLMESCEDYTEEEAQSVADIIREVFENGLTID